jgi:DNA-binding NarL/FixJ family response regulator
VIRVLVVDDHALVRAGICAVVAAAEGIAVVGDAADGREAVTLARGLRPDVVLMDLAMPRLDGAAATREIRAADQAVRVLVLTSFTDEKGIQTALVAGADGYLLKHVPPAELIAAIREIAVGGAPLDARAARVLVAEVRRPRHLPEQESGLTGRERQVLTMLHRGCSNRQIGADLNISERTVKAHLAKIYRRIGVRDRTQAALWAQRYLDTPAG